MLTVCKKVYFKQKLSILFTLLLSLNTCNSDCKIHGYWLCGVYWRGTFCFQGSVALCSLYLSLYSPHVCKQQNIIINVHLTHTFCNAPFTNNNSAYLCLGNIYLFEAFGKIVFCVLDLLVAFMTYRLLSLLQARPSNQNKDDEEEENEETAVTSQNKQTILSKTQCLVYTAISVLFNPIVFNVSTRGNGDILIVFLVMMTLYSLYYRKVKLAAFWYALSIHTKIYPIVYYPAIFLWLAWTFGSKANNNNSGDKKSPTSADTKHKEDNSILAIFTMNWFNSAQIQFMVVVATVGIVSTGLFYYL